MHDFSTYANFFSDMSEMRTIFLDKNENLCYSITIKNLLGENLGG